MYKSIQYNGSVCRLVASYSGAPTYFPHIILYEVDGVKYCYFAYQESSTVYYGILGNNAEIGLTIPLYRISNGTTSQSGSVELQTSTPSDYFDNIRNGNFTLVQRS